MGGRQAQHRHQHQQPIHGCGRGGRAHAGRMDGEGGNEAGIPGVGDGGRGGGAGSGTRHGDKGGIVQGSVGRLVHAQGE